jgi:integrator complex subunit 9
MVINIHEQIAELTGLPRMCKQKQEKVFKPEMPLEHGKLMQDGKLSYFHDIHDFLSQKRQTPCIVFSGHPSLRFGSALDFVTLWKDSPLNSLILTGKDFSLALVPVLC